MIPVKVLSSLRGLFVTEPFNSLTAVQVTSGRAVYVYENNAFILRINI